MRLDGVLSRTPLEFIDGVVICESARLRSFLLTTASLFEPLEAQLIVGAVVIASRNRIVDASAARVL